MRRDHARLTVFFYRYLPLMPPLAGRVSLTPLDIYVPGYTTAARYAEACRVVMREADWMVEDVSATNPKLIRNVFAAARREAPPEKQALERAIRAGFPRARTEGRFELRQPGPGAAEGVCGGR